jgi:hypothetical protein
VASTVRRRTLASKISKGFDRFGPVAVSSTFRL